MKEKKLFSSIGNVSDNLVEEAKNLPPAGKKYILKAVSLVAACAVIITGAAVLLPRGARLYKGGQGNVIAKAVYPESIAFDDYDAKREVLDSNPSDEAFSESVNGFSYRTASLVMTGSEGNVNFSPLSLYYALAVAASGAEGETAEELLSLLGAKDTESLSSACGNFYRRLYTDNKIGKLKIANSLWIDGSFACNTDFAENAARNFYASSFIADFADAGTAKEMSRWISENTGGVLAPEINLNKSQVFSIINTVYFKDEWTSRFDPSATEAGDFYTDGGTVQCSYMNSDFASAGFVKGDGFTRSSLGLKNGGEMVFILPDKGISARELVSSPEKLETAFRDGESSWGRVVWQIPKFDFGTSLELTDTLKACGISSAFDKSADFGGITDGPLFISRISQDTRIAIDENGVEAASFTKIDYNTGTVPSDEAYMILDRPFVYGIISRDGVLLFAGICDNPAEN